MAKSKQRKSGTDSVKPIQGYFLVEVIRDTPDGPKVIQRSTFKNLVVNSGKKQLWRMASGLSSKLFQFGRAGINSVAAISAHTNVITAITSSLHTMDSKTMVGRTLQLIWSYPSGGGSKSGVFKEVAILSQITSPGGSALARALLTPLATKTTADKLKLTYRVRVT